MITGKGWCWIRGMVGMKFSSSGLVMEGGKTGVIIDVQFMLVNTRQLASSMVWFPWNDMGVVR